MPAPKAFLRVGRVTIIEHLLTLHRSLAARVMIVTRTPGLYAGFDAGLVGDVYPWRSPMNGVLAALGNAGGNAILVTACDMPFIELRWLEKIVEEAAGFDISVPMGERGPEPLCAVYGPGVAEPMDAAYLEGRRSLRDFIAGYDPSKVRQLRAEDFGMDYLRFEKTFASVNTPQDYLQLLGGQA